MNRRGRTSGFVWGGAHERCETAKPKTALIYNPRVRGIGYQACVAVARVPRLDRGQQCDGQPGARQDRFGFRLRDDTAGFDISQHLFDYGPPRPTAAPSGLGCSTRCWCGARHRLRDVLGFIIGIARLSTNWLVARLADGLRGGIRNLPLCCNCSSGISRCSRRCRNRPDTLKLPLDGFINHRGLFLPQPIFKERLHRGAGRARARPSCPRWCFTSRLRAGRLSPASRLRCCGSPRAYSVCHCSL